jgi:hypothetical protein
MTPEDEPRAGVAPRHHRAELLFGLAAFGLAAVLLARLGAETTWIEGEPLVRQPGFWPAISLGGMLLFGAAELFGTWRRNRGRAGQPLGPEVLAWARGGEFALWFMAYVWVVPRIGYLPATLVFCPLLALRLGYRRPWTLLAAALTGLTVVVLFKTLLQVKIPGGAVYEALPAGLRNVMIQYF